MASNPETQALLEQALQHVLAEQSRILKHRRKDLMVEPACKLGQLALETWGLLRQGLHKIASTSSLTKQANAIEQAIDGISERNWFYLDISVSSIYQRIEESFSIRPVEEKLNLRGAILIRNHFHNLRLLLLEQLLGARMLINNNDYGSEAERVWQQFLQRELGPEFRVLQGGHLLDYKGNNANAQIDLLIVPTEAAVIVPSSSAGGKVNVLCDQVIAAVMVTSNLTTKKLAEDWEKLKRASELFKFTDEFPGGKEQAWPLCYIVAGQSAPLLNLKAQWEELARADSASRFVPQFLLSLDSGYLYSGATSWPRPRYPGNYVNPGEVASEQGIRAGIGIAWLLTQVRARAKLLQNKPTRSIPRFTKLLDDACLKPAMPPTWSSRFDTFGSVRPIAGILWWGHDCCWAHNRLFLNCLKRDRADLRTTREFHVFRGGVDVSKLTWHEEAEHLRWFRYPVHWQHGELIALEEWTKNADNEAYSKSYAVFNSTTGNEIELSEGWQNAAAKNTEAALRSL